MLDTIQDEIARFMTNLLSGNVPHTVIEEGRNQLRMADEYESVSDYITTIMKFHKKLKNQGQQFDEKDINDLVALHQAIDKYLLFVTSAYQMRQTDVLTKVNTFQTDLCHRIKRLRNQHLDSLADRKINPHVNLAFTSTLNSYQRVCDHVLNIGEVIAGEK